MPPREARHLPLAALIGFCVLLAGFGLAARPTPAPPPTTPLNAVADASIVEIHDHAGQTVVAGEFRSRQDALGNTEKDAALLDRRGNRVIGEVELELPAPGRADRRPELEVDIIGLAPRASFSVMIDDRSVATFTTDDRGSIDMELQEGEAPR